MMNKIDRLFDELSHELADDSVCDFDEISDYDRDPDDYLDPLSLVAGGHVELSVLKRSFVDE